MEAKPEISAELTVFIDQLIVPLLVELIINGHFYSDEASRYDEKTVGRAHAA
jgi:hypothetical protein